MLIVEDLPEIKTNSKFFPMLAFFIASKLLLSNNTGVSQPIRPKGASNSAVLIASLKRQKSLLEIVLLYFKSRLMSETWMKWTRLSSVVISSGEGVCGSFSKSQLGQWMRRANVRITDNNRTRQIIPRATTKKKAIHRFFSVLFSLGSTGGNSSNSAGISSN